MTSPGFYRRLRRTLPLLVAWAVLFSWVIAQAAAGAELRDNGVVRQTIHQVNVNEATAEQLKLLYRVGDTLAQRIIDEREANGVYIDLPDLQDRVKGLGARIIACNADFIAFSGETDLKVKISCPTEDA